MCNEDLDLGKRISVDFGRISMKSKSGFPCEFPRGFLMKKISLGFSTEKNPLEIHHKIHNGIHIGFAEGVPGGARHPRTQEVEASPWACLPHDGAFLANLTSFGQLLQKYSIIETLNGRLSLA